MLLPRYLEHREGSKLDIWWWWYWCCRCPGTRRTSWRRRRRRTCTRHEPLARLPRPTSTKQVCLLSVSILGFFWPSMKFSIWFLNNRFCSKPGAFVGWRLSWWLLAVGLALRSPTCNYFWLLLRAKANAPTSKLGHKYTNPREQAGPNRRWELNRLFTSYNNAKL